MAIDLLESFSPALHKPNIKLAFFDIDGTLLDKEGHYSELLKEEILRIQRLGVRTAIASGRPSFAAKFLMDDLNLIDPGVFCTGSHIYDPLSNHTIRLTHIEPDDCQALLEELRSLNLYYELYTEEQFYIENNFAPHIRDVHAYHLRSRPMLTDLSHVVCNQRITKFLIGIDQSLDGTTLKKIEEKFPSLTFAYACLPAYPQWQFASIINNKACKQEAFQFLLGQYELLPENVISFGDAQSDKIFLSLAGVGVAMGNASDDVKLVADYITKPAWEDGVAYALSKLI